MTSFDMISLSLMWFMVMKLNVTKTMQILRHFYTYDIAQNVQKNLLTWHFILYDNTVKYNFCSSMPSCTSLIIYPQIKIISRTRLCCQEKSDSQSRLCKILSLSNLIVNQKYKKCILYDIVYLIVPNNPSFQHQKNIKPIGIFG